MRDTVGKLRPTPCQRYIAHFQRIRPKLVMVCEYGQVSDSLQALLAGAVDLARRIPDARDLPQLRPRPHRAAGAVWGDSPYQTTDSTIFHSKSPIYIPLIFALHCVVFIINFPAVWYQKIEGITAFLNTRLAPHHNFLNFGHSNWLVGWLARRRLMCPSVRVFVCRDSAK